MSNRLPLDSCSVPISDDDIMEAMRDIHGYLDITPQDFKTVYRIAHQKAIQRILNDITAKDIMSRPVLSVTLQSDLLAVAKLLAENNISGAPVLAGDGRVAGMISEKDFLARLGADMNQSFMAVVVQCLENQGCINLPLRQQKAADIMTAPAIMADLDTPIYAIAVSLAKNRINRLPIVDHDRRIVGIVTRNDIVASYCRLGEMEAAR